MTQQRQVILDEVMAGNHPTADEIYLRVRKKIPKISMGTIYRNLDTLASLGFIRRLVPEQRQMRFDHNTHDHYHISCARCGRIEDAPLQSLSDAMATFENALGNLTKHRIVGHKLEFFGFCPDCAAREKKMNNEDE